MPVRRKFLFKLIFCIRFALPLVLLPAGCVEKPEPPSPLGPPLVEVKPAVLTAGTRELHMNGTLSAERSVTVSFSTVGTVKQVKVEKGEAVKKGQILAELDPRSYRDSLGIAKAKAAQAEDAYRRLLPMYRNKTTPEIKMVEIETGLDQARLAVSMAQKNLADTVLRASVSGIVANRNIEPGSSAAPGIPTFTLVQTENLKAVAPVPEIQVAKLQLGMKATVSIPALQETFEGTVSDIGVLANPLTRTYDVEILLPNPDGVLRIGMIAEIDLRIDTGKDGIAVPPEAVRVDESGARYVFVVTRESKIEQRYVKIDRFISEGIALSEGLSEGERVVTSGTPMLADGMSVRVLDFMPAKAASETESKKAEKSEAASKEAPKNTAKTETLPYEA